MIDGYSGDVGDYVLSIYQGGLPSGDSGSWFQGPDVEMGSIASPILLAIGFMVATIHTGRRREDEDGYTPES